VAVGAAPRNSSCAAGLIFIDMCKFSGTSCIETHANVTYCTANPAKPISPGCAPQDGYVHDAQCVVYRGPHKKYYGRDICYGYNEDTLTIYDVTNKKGPNAASVISRTPYVGASYTVCIPSWSRYSHSY
jgi:hypothetical protein